MLKLFGFLKKKLDRNYSYDTLFLIIALRRHFASKFLFILQDYRILQVR